MVLDLRWVFCTDIRINSEFALYIINWLVFITVVEGVYCAVQADSLYKADYVSSLKVKWVPTSKMRNWIFFLVVRDSSKSHYSKRRKLFINRRSYSPVQGLVLKIFRYYSVKIIIHFFSCVLKRSKHFTRKVKAAFTEVCEGWNGKIM